MYNLLDEMFDYLFPLFRSITGPGIEKSIRAIGEYIPFSYDRIASGTKVFDWVVPPSWTCKRALLLDPDGAVLADTDQSNLHVVSYSTPVDCKLTLDELQPHLHSLPNLPQAIPYVTSYYKPAWGFCIPHSLRQNLRPGLYHAKIDSSFSQDGVMFADYLLEGDSKEEVLLSSYLCHPSLANNELSGPLALLGLYIKLSKWPKRRYSYRFVLAPETIGSLCYLHKNSESMKENIVSGLILTCMGGPAKKLNYKRSRRGNTPVDRLAQRWNAFERLEIREFSPKSGSDERQYCSPGFNLPIGQMAKTVYGGYEGYHNSLDDKEFMKIESVMNSIDQVEDFLWELDNSGYFINLIPYGEPQLGRHGIYPNMNSTATREKSSDEIRDGRKLLNDVLMIMSYSDSCHDMIDISEKNSCGVGDLIEAITLLEEKKMLRFQGAARKAEKL